MATVRIAARFATAFVALTAFAPKAPDTAADAASLKVDSPPVPVILRLEEPGGVVERVSPRGEEDRLDGREGQADSWAHSGSWAA